MEMEKRETGRVEGVLTKKKKGIGGGGCVITSVCSEVKDINWWLIGEYGFANDKSIGDNVSIVL